MRWFSPIATVAGLVSGMVAAPQFLPFIVPNAVGSWGLVLGGWLGWSVLLFSLYAWTARATFLKSVRVLGPSFLPFLLLLLGWAWVPLGGFEPQDFPQRKAEIVLGLALVAHLTIVAFLLVSGALTTGRRRPAAAFFIAGSLFLVGVTLHTVRCDLSGDEPHYLLMTHSLLADGDLELSNNYAREDAKVFYHRGRLEPQGNEHRFDDGRIYSHHPVGPALLAYPGYVLAGRTGAACSFALLASLALAWTLSSLGAMGFKRETCVRVGWVGLFASPLYLYAGLLFAEVPSACVLAGTLWAATRRRWGWVALGMGLLPWAHNRNLLLMIPILLVLAWSMRRGKTSLRALARLLLVSAIPLLLLVAYFVRVYGVWTPLGAHHESFGSLFPLERLAIGVPGLLLDQEVGLWFYFPVFALVPVGIWLGWRREALFKTAMVSLLFYYLFMCGYQNLGLQPAARYFAPVTPLLLVALAPGLEALGRASRGWRRGAFLLWGVSAFLGYLLAAVPWARYSHLQGEAWLLIILERFTGIPWSRWEPSFHAAVVEPRSYLLSLFWLGVVGVLSWRFVAASSSRGRP